MALMHWLFAAAPMWLVHHLGEGGIAARAVALAGLAVYVLTLLAVCVLALAAVVKALRFTGRQFTTGYRKGATRR